MSDKKREVVYIYRIYFPDSDKCYIGQTCDLQKRMMQHLQVDNGSAVHRALLKYDDWDITNLHTCYSRDDANRIEIEEIRNFNSVAPNGYNLTHGGAAERPSDEARQKTSDALMGHKVSPETRRKISIKAKGNQRAKGHKHTDEVKERIGDAHRGKKLAEEHKRKLSISHTGQPHTEDRKKKISASCKGRKITEDHKKKIGIANKGRKQTEEHKRKLAESRRGSKRSDETKCKMSLSHQKRAYKGYKQKLKELEENKTR